MDCCEMQYGLHRAPWRAPVAPLTVNGAMQVQFLEPTPPEEDLILVSTVTSIEEYRDDPSRRDAVQVDLQLVQVSFCCMSCTRLWL